MSAFWVWAVWIAAGVAIAKLAFGQRRWFTHVTSQVRPGAVQPTDRGLTMLVWRDLLVAAAAVALVAAVTMRYHVSNQELYRSLDQATDLASVGGGDVEAGQVETLMALILDRPVTAVEQGTVEEEESSETQYAIVVGDVDESEEDVDLDSGVC